MTLKTTLSQLMKLSWHIQRMRKQSRSKALSAAWTILTNEDITVFYLTRKLNHHRPLKPATVDQFALFNK